MEVRAPAEEVGSSVETVHIRKLLSLENYLGGLTSGENGSLLSACQTLDRGSAY